jgi:hypothetical protein
MDSPTVYKGLSTDFALIWDKKIVQKPRFLVNDEKERIAGLFTLTPPPWHG